MMGLRAAIPLAPAAFTHVAAVFDKSAGTISIYVNGQLEGTTYFTPNTDVREYNTNLWRIGVAGPYWGQLALGCPWHHR